MKRLIFVHHKANIAIVQFQLNAFDSIKAKSPDAIVGFRYSKIKWNTDSDPMDIPALNSLFANAVRPAVHSSLSSYGLHVLSLSQNRLTFKLLTNLNPHRKKRRGEMENTDIFRVAHERTWKWIMDLEKKKKKNVQPKTNPPARFESY